VRGECGPAGRPRSEYLHGARKRKVNQLPPSILVRECAELRRQLGQTLDVIAAGVVLTDAQRDTVLDALDVAADYKRDRAATCPDCEASPAELCGTCEWRLAHADEYDALAETLRGSGHGLR
jgi:hypothetical protein